MFSVYIITNKPHGTLYVGHTENLVFRMWEHKNKAYKGFASKYNLDKLVWHEEHENRESAFVRERQMKEWNRAWKVECIEKVNLDWIDLTEGLSVYIG